MHKAALSKTRRRSLAVLVIFLLFGFTTLIGRLFFLQIVVGEEYQAKAFDQQTRAQTLDARRGAIYDRNGKFLARSSTVWNVCISPAEIMADMKKTDDYDKLKRLALDLAAILDVDATKILDDARHTSSYYKRVKVRVETNVREQVLECITANKYVGVFFEEATKRYYPYGSLASTIIGFTDYDNNGAYGIEAKYDSVLSGSSGMVVSAKNAWGADMDYKYQQKYDARDGNSIVLTIDETIQHFVERNLETAIIEHRISNRACGIVMNVKTGEILAMATEPDFDPNQPYVIANPAHAAILEEMTPGSKEYIDQRNEFWYEQWRNKAISDPYEPGSVFKIITAAAGLDSKVVRLDDQFICTGSIKVAGETIGCHEHHGHGEIDFIQGMQKSCNPVFILLGQRIGARNFYDFVRNFGLGELSGIDLPGEAPGILHSYNTLSRPGMVELSSSAFGQSMKMTPIQMITAVSAAVNGGQLMQPYIVKQILDSDGNVIETTQPTVKREAISAETSEMMKYLTEMVVDGGSGRLAALPGYRIGGKTGTSEKLDQKSDKPENVLSFVGFAPMDDPQYAVLVVLDTPDLGRDNIFGSVIAAPVVGAIMQEMLPYLGIDPQYTQEELEEKIVTIPNMIGMKPHDARATLTNLGMQTRFIGNGGEVLRQIPQSRGKMPKGSSVILYTSENELKTDIVVPDVVGLTAQEANKLLVELGLNIELRGTLTEGVPTIVREQWPLANAEAGTGEVIIVTLIKKPDETRAVVTLPDLEPQGRSAGQ